jgi:hypothetical protein
MNEDRSIYSRVSPLDDMYVPERAEQAPKSGFRRGQFFAALALTLPAALALANVPGTLLFFADTEGAGGNALTAAPLDFLVDADAPMAIALTVGDGEEEGDAFSPFVIPSPGSIGFEYRITVEETGGNPAFCAALQLFGTPPLFDYVGPLLGLSTATTTEVAPWSLLLYLPEGSGIADGAVCMVELVYSGFQEGGEAGQEFHDEERLALMITANIPEPEAAFAPLLLSAPEEPEEEPVIEDEPKEEEVPPAEPPPAEEPLVEEPEEPAPPPAEPEPEAPTE